MNRGADADRSKSAPPRVQSLFVVRELVSDKLQLLLQVTLVPFFHPIYPLLFELHYALYGALQYALRIHYFQYFCMR